MRIPGIIYGTAWKKERTETLVTAAVLLGFRGIDTACQPKHYDEPGVGAAIASCASAGINRSDIYLQSKFTPAAGHDPDRIPYDPTAPLNVQVRQSFEASLRNLRTTWLDCLILHSPLPTHRQTMEAWRAMEAVCQAGGALQIGISNCYSLDQLRRLHDAAEIKPSVVQNRFYAGTAYDRPIRAFCKDAEIIYQPFWTLTANPHILSHRTTTTLAAQHGRTAAQVLFRYLTHEGAVPLTGTTSEKHMREDLQIFEFELAEDERAAMSRLF